MPAAPGVSGAILSDVNRVLAALLALLPGGLSIHRFPCKKTGLGILYLLFVWTVIPAFIAFINGSSYPVQGDAKLARARQRKSFAEIVREERARPPRLDRARLSPGRHDDLLVLDSRRYTLITEPLDAAQARTLVRHGARATFGPCGCGGRCGIQILHQDALARLRLPRWQGNPSIGQGPKHPGSLSSWAAVEPPATTRVLASGHVIWAQALA